MRFYLEDISLKNKKNKMKRNISCKLGLWLKRKRSSLYDIIMGRITWFLWRNLIKRVFLLLRYYYFTLKNIFKSQFWTIIYQANQFTHKNKILTILKLYTEKSTKYQKQQSTNNTNTTKIYPRTLPSLKDYLSPNLKFFFVNKTSLWINTFYSFLINLISTFFCEKRRARVELIEFKLAMEIK